MDRIAANTKTLNFINNYIMPFNSPYQRSSKQYFMFIDKNHKKISAALRESFLQTLEQTNMIILFLRKFDNSNQLKILKIKFSSLFIKDIYILPIMLITKLCYLCRCGTNAVKFPTLASFPFCQKQLFFRFCESSKQEKSGRSHDQREQTNQDKTEDFGKSEKKKEGHQHNIKQPHHKHGPGCTHDHGHHHDHHHHGPGFGQAHLPHNNNPPNVKLSKLGFDQLIAINTEDALKYARLIYSQEQQVLKDIQKEREEGLKLLNFHAKTEHQFKEKHRKLDENIIEFEQEAMLSLTRANKEVEQSKTAAVANIAKQFIEIADCLASCRRMAEERTHDLFIHKILETERLMNEIMEQCGIEELDPTGKPYDPNSQESLSTVPTPPGAKANYVAETLQRGYLMHGRLLRSARVVIFS